MTFQPKFADSMQGDRFVVGPSVREARRAVRAAALPGAEITRLRLQIGAKTLFLVGLITTLLRLAA